MTKKTQLRFLPRILLLLLAVAWHGSFAATAAGRVVFATGNPVATDSAGTQRSLGRGDDVFAGDDLRTPVNSRLQVSFEDGAYISLQPNSEYLIEEYKYSGKPDGTESAVYRLLKGGVRAVTGLIGREHHEAYKVKTSVATIGIRGTGHNTRICQGDCSGKADGLYHSTWEGITYVVNNVEEVEVPAGRGVFVKDINAPIRFLSQPPAVTAVDTASEKEDEQKEDEDETQVVSVGDQRNDTGEQTVIVGEEGGGVTPTSSTVLTGKGMGGVAPDDMDPTRADIIGGSEVSIFLNSNNDAIGALLTEFDDSGTARRTVGTIDLGAMLGGDDPASVQEVNSLLAAADPADIELFKQNPAHAAETAILADGVGWTRWTGGNVLSFDDAGDTNVDVLTGFQSVHLIFGDEPASMPASGTATYDFIGGTRSTSVSGASIGNGVTGGSLYADFGSGEGGLFMNVNHDGADYRVGGKLAVDSLENGFSDINILASTTTSGSACNPSCPTFIDGGFAAPLSGSFPKYAGLDYAIQEDDVITGVAGFGYRPPGSTSVQSPLILTAVSPLPAPSYAEPTFGSDGNGFAAAGNDVIGAVFTDPFDATRQVSTVDPRGMLAGDDPAAVAEFGAMLVRADPVAVAKFEENPAAVAESLINADGTGWGRWTGGNILNIDSSGNTAVDPLTGNQSVHFIFGPEPPSIPTSGSAYYLFSGGTRSTSSSGATIGNGVTGGTILVDFLYAMGEINMTVNHNGGDYLVNGPFGSLVIDNVNNGIFDSGGGVPTSTALGGSACNPGCTTFIGGGFAGPMDLSGSPSHVGIHYLIQEQDPIMGVAGFDYTPM